MELSSGLSEWPFTNSLAPLLSTFCQSQLHSFTGIPEQNFSLCGLMTAGRRTTLKAPSHKYFQTEEETV